MEMPSGPRMKQSADAGPDGGSRSVRERTPFALISAAAASVSRYSEAEMVEALMRVRRRRADGVFAFQRCKEDPRRRQD